ncbi:hypothetical protein STEG23_026373 [Scotinomys teguina]
MARKAGQGEEEEVAQSQEAKREDASPPWREEDVGVTEKKTPITERVEKEKRAELDHGEGKIYIGSTLVDQKVCMDADGQGLQTEKKLKDLELQTSVQLYNGFKTIMLLAYCMNSEIVSSYFSDLISSEFCC